MKSTFVIAKKELKGFYSTPSYFFVTFLISVILSLLYPVHFSMFAEGLQMAAPGLAGNQQSNIHYGLFLRHLSYLNLILIFIVPAFSMKLISEEKKMRTFDLLLTSPITSWDIVFGKFIALAGAVSGIMVMALLYPMMTSILVSQIHWPSLLLAFGGILSLSFVYAAMNLFCSSLTESILIAYIMSVVLNVSVWFVGVGVEAVDGQTARQIFEHISLASHLSGMVEGLLRVQSAVFFLTFIGLFLFLAERVVESHRWRAL